ncbi:hypothetical protein D3C85_1591860 [compost metagenome]
MQHAISQHVKDADKRDELIKKLTNTIHECASDLQAEYLSSVERIRKVLTA